MFARIIPVRDGKITINGKEYTIDEAIENGLIDEVGYDEEGRQYAVIRQ